ncbi:MAG TPA: sensor histidine kinase KdpD [Pirellulales bacterium]|nr:sensor histidine kinase KdpD [Pirellulales bacterium]
MTDNRPNPDAVLAQVQAEEARAGRGKLKIFFGFSAGVGKTYTMLETARRDVSSGRDVWIGVVETHGRSDTAALLLGMDIIPLREIDYRGVKLKEFDLDGARERRPELLVVDELAHTNAPGSRHAKRWQDVEELLAAGIDVYTTMNVQHLESLNDVIAQITGVVVQETVPDAVLEKADEIELVDLPPEDLLDRFRHGQVYVPAQAERALQSFFRKSNLVALRELALRQMADRVNADVQRARLGGASPQVWPTAERLLVCVSPSPLSPRVVRTAKRMATSLRADWIAAYVEPSDPEVLDVKARQRLAQNLRLAEQLGAEIVTLAGSNPADELLSYARQRNVTRIVVGKSGHPSWRRLFRGNLIDDLLRNSREIDIHVIHGVEVPEGKPPPPEQHVIAWHQYARALAVVAVCGLVDAAIFRLKLAEANLVMVLLLGVVYSAARYGRGPGILASIASVLLFDFFFVLPYLTFAVSDTQYLLTFVVMFGIAVLISTLTSRVREQAQLSRERARRTEALFHMSQRLTGQVGTHQLAGVALQQLTAIFAGDVALFLPDEEKRLKLAVGSHADFALRENEVAVAQWVFAHQQQAGMGTNTLPSAHALYLPLVGSQGSVGVLAIRPADPDQLLIFDQRQLLETFASQIALALEREQLAAQVQAVLLQAEAERLRSSLLASVSHDLRTPLAVITGASSSLLESDGTLAPETRRELIQTIFDDSNRLTRLVDNLLDMTRIESGSVVLNKQPHIIEEIIGSALRRLAKPLTGRQIKTHLPDNLPLTPLDEMLIEQVLTNLLENVQKYTPAGSPIDISAWPQEGQLIVEVADRGPGIPDDERDLIFEKFYRGQAAAVDGRRGAGLGLAICKAIITAHGGRIWAENRAGGGARFCFSLPVGAGEALSANKA